MTNITLFSQIIQKLNRSKFNKLVKEKETDKHNKGFNSWNYTKHYYNIAQISSKNT